jgi:chromosome partitioning protein
MYIRVANHNGGAGKTTTAVHLAAYLQALDLTLLIDGASENNLVPFNPLGLTITAFTEYQDFSAK